MRNICWSPEWSDKYLLWVIILHTLNQKLKIKTFKKYLFFIFYQIYYYLMLSFNNIIYLGFPSGPGERNSYPTRDWPRLAQDCPGVSDGGMGQQWLAAGLRALSAAVRPWDLLKEVAIILITSTIVWPQAKQQGGNSAPPINRKLD